MIRFLRRSASLVGVCALALTIGCGDSSTKKVTCDGGACGDAAGKDASRDILSDPADLGVRLDVVSPDGLRPDSTPVQNPDGAIPDTLVESDTPVPSPDTQPVTPDTGVDAGDAAKPETGLPDTQLPDTGIDTTALQPDTALPDAGIDAPVTLDTASDLAPDAGSDVSADVFDDAGDAADAETDV